MKPNFVLNSLLILPSLTRCHILKLQNPLSKDFLQMQFSGFSIKQSTDISAVLEEKIGKK